MERTMPKVSIIMGAYNCEATLANCINSILNQSCTDWEFIICDDCSSDNTYALLKEYAGMDKRIIVLRNDKNLRLAASLNKCLSVAKGEYIARIDADDDCFPSRLEEQMKFLDDHKEYDVVGCEVLIFDGEKELYVRRVAERPTKDILKFGVPFIHPTIMMRKKCYDALGGYRVSKETARAEDLDLWFRFYEKGFRGYNIPKVLCRYHESAEDYNKRTLKAAIGTSKIFLQGYRRLHFPWYTRIYAAKPIISALLPRKFMMAYHARRRKKINQ